MMKTKIAQETRVRIDDHGAIPESAANDNIERTLARLRSVEGVNLF